MVKRRNVLLRRLSAFICALFVLSSVGREVVYAQDGYEIPSTPPPGAGSTSPHGIKFSIDLGRLLEIFKGGQTKPVVEDLNANGPRFPDSFGIGTFDVQGYVRGGWPVVIDFAPQPGSCTWLEVNVGQQKWSHIIDFDGRKGRRLISVAVPDDIASSAQPAKYVVHSATPSCARGAGESPVDRAPSRIEIYGIGAGPRAVGSVAIGDLQFGPSTPNIPHDKVTISYYAKFEFNHAAVEILRFNQDQRGQVNVQRIHTRRTDVVQVGRNSDSWDGNRDTGERSLGVHHLQVRAWFTQENDKSWVGAISPDSVLIMKQ